MKGLVLLVLGFVLVCAGVFLISRARAMSSTVARQLDGQSDTLYDFRDRIKMFGFGFGMVVIGCASGYRAFVE